MTTIKELIDYLSQFDPEKKVWVLYDQSTLYEASFRPTCPEYMESLLLDDKDVAKVSFGDLLMEVG